MYFAISYPKGGTDRPRVFAFDQSCRLRSISLLLMAVPKLILDTLY